MFFDNSWFSLICIAIHAMLHVSSFQFILSTKRNKVYNIIWPEMRWHSMIFAYRSIVLMFLIWLCMNAYLHPAVVVYLRGPIVIGTMMCADGITAFYKSRNMVDNADSTMRGNPYPPYVPAYAIKMHNMFYSVSQVLATANILYRGFNTVFYQLLAIQTAPFGMTLVKKGIMKQAGWHMSYTLALLSSYWYGWMIPHDYTRYVYWGSVILFCVGRFRYNMNKYLLWSAAIAVQWYMMYMDTRMYEQIAYYSDSTIVWKPEA